MIWMKQSQQLQAYQQRATTWIYDMRLRNCFIIWKRHQQQRVENRNIIENFEIKQNRAAAQRVSNHIRACVMLMSHAYHLCVFFTCMFVFHSF